MLGKDTPQIAGEIEEAIKFLVFAIEKSKNNEKPVIFHSIKVGIYLYREGYAKEMVIAGILHDLLEDSDVAFEEIEKRFGKRAARLVKANSFDKGVVDKRERYSQTFRRCLKVGKDALVIKAADILDNSYYLRFAPNKILKNLFLGKMKHFVENTREIIGTENIWKELNERYIQLSQQ